jgi:hypothetical protein
MITCSERWKLDILFRSYFMEYSPSWEANQFSASREIPHISWNLNIHYRIHKFPPPLPILSQLKPVHAPTYHFLEVHFNIIIPFTFESSNWTLPSGFWRKYVFKICTGFLDIQKLERHEISSNLFRKNFHDVMVRSGPVWYHWIEQGRTFVVRSGSDHPSPSRTTPQASLASLRSKSRRQCIWSDHSSQTSGTIDLIWMSIDAKSLN